MNYNKRFSLPKESTPQTRQHCSAWIASGRRGLPNEDWKSPIDQEAEITKLKDGRAAMAYKAENAVDMESGAIVAVTTHGGAAADTATVQETVVEAAIAVAGLIAGKTSEGEYPVHPDGVEEVVTDKGYHSNDVALVANEAAPRMVRKLDLAENKHHVHSFGLTS